MSVRRLFFGAAAIVVALALAEGLCLLSTPLLERATGLDLSPTSKIYRGQRERIDQLLQGQKGDTFDPQLGWRYRPNYRSELYTSNSAGLRGQREYAAETPPGVLRLAAFGDSFVYGSEVGDEECWPRLLERTDERLEVLNFGVGGYGTDQALLAYRKVGKHYQPEVVLIGFDPACLRRNVSVYPRFSSTKDWAHVKPRFLLEPDGGLRLLGLPLTQAEDYRRYRDRPELVRELGLHDAWYEPLVYENPLYDASALVRVLTQGGLLVYRHWLEPGRLLKGGRFNPQSEAFRITVATLADFSLEVKESGGIPLVLLLPDATVLGAGGRAPRLTYAPLAAALVEKHVAVLDVAEAFPRAAQAATFFMPGGHYSPAANRVVARAVWDCLQAKELIDAR